MPKVTILKRRWTDGPCGHRPVRKMIRDNGCQRSGRTTPHNVLLVKDNDKLYTEIKIRVVRLEYRVWVNIYGISNTVGES